MTISELGSMGELIAAVATVATLAYLAIQIRHSTLATKVANHQASISSSGAVFSALYTAPGFSSAFARGLADFDALSHVEQTQLHFFLAQLVLFYKDNLESNQAGILDDDTMSAWEEFTASILATRGGRTWWRLAERSYIEAVRSRLSAAIERTQPYDEVYPFLLPPPN